MLQMFQALSLQDKIVKYRLNTDWHIWIREIYRLLYSIQKGNFKILVWMLNTTIIDWRRMQRNIDVLLLPEAERH